MVSTYKQKTLLFNKNYISFQLEVIASELQIFVLLKRTLQKFKELIIIEYIYFYYTYLLMIISPKVNIIIPIINAMATMTAIRIPKTEIAGFNITFTSFSSSCFYKVEGVQPGYDRSFR